MYSVETDPPCASFSLGVQRESHAPEMCRTVSQSVSQSVRQAGREGGRQAGRQTGSPAQQVAADGACAVTVRHAPEMCRCAPASASRGGAPEVDTRYAINM